MERAARRFASWVLAIHLVVLVALIVLVGYAAREVYESTRRQALDQVCIRQELLAAQAARGIEGFYRFALDGLELTQPISQDVLRTMVWERLRGRAVCLLEIDTRSGKVIHSFTDAGELRADDLAARAARELAVPTKPVISAPFDFRGSMHTFLAAPAPTAGRALVALVPLHNIESRFLNDINEPVNIGAMLVDDRFIILSAEDRPLVGAPLTGDNIDPRIRDSAHAFTESGLRTTREFLHRVSINGVMLDPAMVTAQPINLPDGKRWWLVVSSTLSEVDQVVGRFLRRIIIGSLIVILAMTGVLMSTSFQLIRSRLRIERLQHEMITRELASARDIQLAWLPEAQGTKINLDVAAMNKPASHVSGDFYNWFELPDGRAVIVIGDVTGHGLPAAFLMATTQLLVRTTIESRGDPGAALRQVNRLLCSHVFGGQFVTMLVMTVNLCNNEIEVANAGHPPPLIGSGDSFTALALKPQLVLAVDESVQYETQRFELAPGSSILLYTDGITDLQSPTGQRLGVEGLANSLFGRFDTAASLMDAASDAIESFRQGREAADDLTLVALQLAPTPRETSPDVEPAATRTA